MAFDRPAALRQAEKLAGLGKLEPAIAEYTRVLEDQPQDWKTANTLGDLCIRAGYTEQAVQHFVRIADHFYREGFFPKAAALYKKILKHQPAHEHALMQAADIAARAGLLADARTQLNAVAKLRRDRRDVSGVSRILIRLAELDPDDLIARRAGAQARVDLGEPQAALQELKALAALLLQDDRYDVAVHVLQDALAIDPGDLQAHADLGRALVLSGNAEGAVPHLIATGVVAEPSWLVSVAETLFRDGRPAPAMTLLERLAARGEAHPDLVSLGSTLAVTQPDLGYQIATMLVDAAVARSEWRLAAEALQAFLGRAPSHIGALTRLLEIAFDGGMDETVDDTQAQLADAYLAAGCAAEARNIAEDLALRHPNDAANQARLTRAFELLGSGDPSVAIEASALATFLDELPAEPEPLAPVQPFAPVEPLLPSEPPARLDPPIAATMPTELSRPPVPDPPKAVPPVATEPRIATPDVRHRSKTAEVDLTVVLEEMRKPSATPAAAPTASAPLSEDIEEVFAQLREEAGSRGGGDTADQDFTRGMLLLRSGDPNGAVPFLEKAVRMPRFRFEAASALARVFLGRQETAASIEWMERAAEAPPTTPEAGHSLLFELANALELIGEGSRALAIYLELQAEAGDFRDVSERVDRLLKVQAE